MFFYYESKFKTFCVCVGGGGGQKGMGGLSKCIFYKESKSNKKKKILVWRGRLGGEGGGGLGGDRWMDR